MRKITDSKSKVNYTKSALSKRPEYLMDWVILIIFLLFFLFLPPPLISLSLCFSVGLRAERVMTAASVFEPDSDWLWVPTHRQIKRLSIMYISNRDSWTVFKSVEFVSKSSKVMTHQKQCLRYQRVHPVLTKDWSFHGRTQQFHQTNLHIGLFSGDRVQEKLHSRYEKVACKWRGGKWNGLMKFGVSWGCKSRRCWPVY